MRVTVIIPTKNEERNIKLILSDLHAQTEKPAAIIIADNHSTDRTRAIARKLGSKVIAGGLPSVGRNQGALKAKTDYLLFLDADVRIDDRRFIERSVKEMKRRRLQAATVPNLPGWTGKETLAQRIWLRFMHVMMNTWIRMVSRTPAACGLATCLLFERKAFWKAGGFDVNVLWAEDTELIGRMIENGFRFGMLRTRITASTRRALEQGPVRFYYNVLVLSMYRWFRGEITDWTAYRKITGKRDHYAFTKPVTKH